MERDGQRYAQVVGLPDAESDVTVLAELLIEDPPPAPTGTLRLDWAFADIGG